MRVNRDPNVLGRVTRAIAAAGEWDGAEIGFYSALGCSIAAGTVRLAHAGFAAPGRADHHLCRYVDARAARRSSREDETGRTRVDHPALVLWFILLQPWRWFR
jgi:hypothetical protein